MTYEILFVSVALLGGILALGLGSLIASFRILTHGKEDLAKEREQYFKMVEQTRRHYESALDSMHRKFMARNLPDYAYSEGAKSALHVPRQVSGAVEGSNGEMFESQEQQDAIVKASQFGLSYTDALKRIRQDQQTPAGPVGNQDFDAL